MKTNKSTSVKLFAVLFASGLTTATVPAATIDWGSGAQNISSNP